jgi:transcriptional regulator with PAS, ATPase and Fis domain
VAVNCAAIPEHLVEAELFGCAEGAFTSAARARPGLFEQAEGGTIFLDEVGELDLRDQAKLLRVLQERTVRPLGGSEPRRLDLRIVAACDCDLRRALEDGRLRADLYYRLRVVEINVPPLRERKQDLLPLSLHFLSSFRATMRHRVSRAAASHARRWWRIAGHGALNAAMPTRYLEGLGLVRLAPH